MEKIEGEARLRGGVEGEEGEKKRGWKGEKDRGTRKNVEKDISLYLSFSLSLYSVAMSRLLPVDHHGT